MSGFEWDEGKALENERKHGISFEEARSVFDDFDVRFFFDHEHSVTEDRFMIVGRSNRERMLAVWHTYRDPRIRIIGVRHATAAERKTYEEKRPNR